jgi:hypothetical protein
MSADAVRLTFPQSRFGLRLRSRARRERPADSAFEPIDALPLDLSQLLAPDRWIRHGRTGAELRKVLGVIHAHLSETRRLLGLPTTATPLRDAPAVRELASLVQRDVSTLKIDGAWELAGDLKRLNLRLGDREYMTSRLEYEQRRAAVAGRWHGWNAHFDAHELQLLLNAFKLREPTLAHHARAVDRLTFLYFQREESGRDRRARAELKKLYLTLLAPLLLLMLAGFGLAVNFVTHGRVWEALVLTACAGGLGSTLSGIFKVRDQLVRLEELRSFGPAMRVQPLIGACAGLIVFLALQSHAVSLGSTASSGWAGKGLLAFAAGFSEPFFLGIVQRVAVVPDRPTDGTAKKS